MVSHTIGSDLMVHPIFQSIVKMVIWLSTSYLIFYNIYVIYVVFGQYVYISDHFRRFTYFQLLTGIFLPSFYVISRNEREKSIKKVHRTLLEELRGLPDYHEKIRAITNLYNRNYVLRQVLLCLLMIVGLYFITMYSGLIRFISLLAELGFVLYLSNSYGNDPIEILYTERYEKLLYMD